MTDPSIRETIRATIEKFGNSVPQKAKRQAEEAALKIYEEGVPPAQAIGLTSENAEALYQHGYQLFQSGKYKEAMGCFFFLKDLQPDSFRYTFALAATYQYMRDYESAAANYIFCTGLEPNNPVPFFHLYDCFMKLNQQLSALHAITRVIALTEKREDYAPLLARAQLEYKRLLIDLKMKPES